MATRQLGSHIEVLRQSKNLNKTYMVTRILGYPIYFESQRNHIWLPGYLDIYEIEINETWLPSYLAPTIKY